MINQFSRTETLLGEGAMKKLSNARVAVFGIGGVGGHAVDALVRSGVGAIDIIDNDTVSLTNINRQLIATHSTVGLSKTEVMEKHIKDINPDIKVVRHDIFYTPETSDHFNFRDYDYIVDAIDTVSGKIELILKAQAAGVPIISSMGAGNKLDPTAFKVADIYKTSVCPLAKVIRQELRKRGIKKLKVVYSEELPITPEVPSEELKGNRPAPGSTAFVPSVAGLIIASEVIKDLIRT